MEDAEDKVTKDTKETKGTMLNAQCKMRNAHKGLDGLRG
jgi:hypothetical protein